MSIKKTNWCSYWSTRPIRLINDGHESETVILTTTLYSLPKKTRHRTDFEDDCDQKPNTFLA